MSSNSIQPFAFHGETVRTIENNGNPLFCGTDVAKVLGYQNVNDAILRHCKGVVKRYPLQTPGGIQQIRFITEGDLYRLIASSKLPQAQEFESWIFDEVIPSIRKHGGYMAGQESMTPEQMALASMRWLQSKVEEQQKQIASQKPKVLFADSVETSSNSVLVGELARDLRQNGVDTGQNRLYEWLRNHGYLISRHGEHWNEPQQRYVERGLFEVKTRTINNADGTVAVKRTTKVTGKGRVYFTNKFLGGHAANPLAIDDSDPEGIK